MSIKSKATAAANATVNGIKKVTPEAMHFDGEKRIWSSSELRQSKATLESQAKALDAVNKDIEDAIKRHGKASEKLLKKGKEAEAAYNATKQELGVLRGGVGASIKEMFSNVANLFRGKPDTKTYAEEAAKILEKGKVGRIERILSKPFRIAANNPKVTAVAGALGVAALAGSYFKGRAEKRTEREAQAEMMEAQAQMQAAATRAQQGPYTNSASQAVVDAAIAEGKAGSQTEALAARQAAQGQAPVAAAL